MITSAPPAAFVIVAEIGNTDHSEAGAKMMAMMKSIAAHEPITTSKTMAATATETHRIYRAARRDRC
jgi:hypothetical protein